MKSKEFYKIKPYTYFILRKSDNLKYHGVRWANKESPIKDFALNYFGSSKSNKSFCEEFKRNPKNFFYRICWTFDNKEEAIEYETKVNKKIFRRSDFVNKNAFPAILLDEQSIKKISEAKKGKSTSTTKHKLAVIESNKTRILGPEFRAKCSKINKGKRFSKEFRNKISRSKTGIKLTISHKKNIGLGVKGEKNGMFGRTHSTEAREKISKSKIGKTPWNKGKKYKTGNIPWNKGISWKRKINRKELNSYV